MDVGIFAVAIVAVTVAATIFVLFKREDRPASWEELARFGLVNRATRLTLEAGRQPMLVVDGKSAPINAPPVTPELLAAARMSLGSQPSVRIVFGNRVHGDAVVRGMSETKIELELRPA